MKRALSVFLICILTLLTFTSCGPKHPIYEFREKLQKANNYQIESIWTDKPSGNTVTLTYSIDGRIKHNNEALYNEEAYYETVGSVTYKYTKSDDGSWSKKAMESTDPGIPRVDGTIDILFNPDIYIQIESDSEEKLTYKKKTDASLDQFEDITMIIEGDKCTIHASEKTNNVIMNITYVFSNVGKVNLTLPNS